MDSNSLIALVAAARLSKKPINPLVLQRLNQEKPKRKIKTFKEFSRNPVHHLGKKFMRLSLSHPDNR